MFKNFFFAVAMATVASDFHLLSSNAMPLSDSLSLWNLFDFGEQQIQLLNRTQQFLVQNHFDIQALVHFNSTVLAEVLRPLHEQKSEVSHNCDLAIP